MILRTGSLYHTHFMWKVTEQTPFVCDKLRYGRVKECKSKAAENEKIIYSERTVVKYTNSLKLC